MSKQSEIENLKIKLEETEKLLYAATSFLADSYAARDAGMCVNHGKKEKFKHIEPISKISMGTLLKKYKELKNQFGV